MMNKGFAEGLSRKTVELFLEEVGDQRAGERAEVEQAGLKLIRELGQGLSDLKDMQGMIDPFCGDIDLWVSCQDIDDLLNDIESDNSYLDSRLNVVKSTFY